MKPYTTKPIQGDKKAFMTFYKPSETTIFIGTKSQCKRRTANCNSIWAGQTELTKGFIKHLEK